MLLLHLHDALEILMMSVALGMDAFSLAIGIGLQGLRRSRALELIFYIGVFHVIMTCAGIYAGIALSNVLGNIAKWFGAFLLIGLGIHMIYGSLFVKNSQSSVDVTDAAMLLFAASVSVDALSVGFSLGLRSTAYGIVAAIMFGLVGALMCGLGLLIGKRASHLVGSYGEIIGAVILIGFGIHFVLA